MAAKLIVGDTVYVPCAVSTALIGRDTALYKTEVVSVERKSIRIKLPDGTHSDLIGTSRVHRDVGLLVIEVGDFGSETALLDPLAKSVLQFFRLLVPDDQVRSVKVRSRGELEKFWQINQNAYSHVVLIAHGDVDLLRFGVDGDVNVADLVQCFDVLGAQPKTFISLACKTGYSSFAAKFSCAAICRELVAPFHSVHGAIASQFCQSFFAAHFLEGKSSRVAFNRARTSVTGGARFRFWSAGYMTPEA